MMTTKKSNTVTIPADMYDALEKVTRDLKISKADVLRRAMMLFEHALTADKVELTIGEKRHKVVVK
jgi:hypothetical protein